MVVDPQKVIFKFNVTTTTASASCGHRRLIIVESVHQGCQEDHLSNTSSTGLDNLQNVAKDCNRKHNCTYDITTDRNCTSRFDNNLSPFGSYRCVLPSAIFDLCQTYSVNNFSDSELYLVLNASILNSKIICSLNITGSQLYNVKFSDKYGVALQENKINCSNLKIISNTKIFCSDLDKKSSIKYVLMNNLSSISVKFGPDRPIMFRWLVVLILSWAFGKNFSVLLTIFVRFFKFYFCVRNLGHITRI